MGKSVARFVVPGTAFEKALELAVTFARDTGLTVENFGPNHVQLTKGSIWWTGKRVLSVFAWGVPEGAMIQVEVWVEGLVTLNANPTEFVGMIPRRDAWRIASAFVSRFGVAPKAVFAHY